jgi:pimeloyl-ACP methyl ester carboxylesterase
MTVSTDYVFLHGGGQAGWVWRETIAALHQQADGKFGRALALDVPGCGNKRGRNTSNLGVDDIVTELIANISASGLKDVILVGHSQAGTILPRLVDKRPDLFRRLVYVSCIAPLPGQTIIQQMGSGLHGSNENEVGWPVDPKTIDARTRYSQMFCNDMSAADASDFIARLGKDNWPAQTMSASDWRNDHLVKVPSTYVFCLRDGILPVAWQETFASRLRVQRRAWIDAGHQVMNTRPQALAEVLRYEAIEVSGE